MRLEIDRYSERQIQRAADSLRQEIRALVEAGELAPEDEAECLIEEVRESIRMKFIVVERGDEQIVKIFDPNITHSDKVDTGLDERPIGGGELMGDQLIWGSQSFRNEFGFYKPSDEETAAVVLSGIDTLIEDWLREKC